MIELTRYSLFASHPEIVAWTSGRPGGVSQGPYASLNCSYSVGDDLLHVAQNRERLEPYLRVCQLVELDQVHGNRVVGVESAAKGGGNQILGTADGMISEQKGIALGIKHADCQAAIVYDPVRQLLGAAHAGWRGLVAGVYSSLISAACDRGSRPSQLKVAISPSLGPCCSQFIHWRQELGPWAQKYRVGDEESCYFNLHQIAFDQLTALGIDPANLSIDQRCTRCHSEQFFSFRRANPTGRMLTLIARIDTPGS